MNVASKELCQELYEVSGWDEPIITGFAQYMWHIPGNKVVSFSNMQLASAYPKEYCPAYGLGYLLRKLPTPCAIYHNAVDYVARCSTFEEMTSVPRIHTASPRRFELRADTPEDAACKLAIELFKQGVLK